MKNILFLALCLVLSLQFQSCKDDDEDNGWREANEAAFEAVSKDAAYVAKTTPEGPGTIYVKVLKSGTGTVHPIFTSNVKVLYKGSYYDGTVFNPGTSETGVPVILSVRPTDSMNTNTIVVSGLSIALQNMVIGDKWEVWVPWTLGYGSVDSKVLAYSTLVFEVELLEIIQYP